MESRQVLAGALHEAAERTLAFPAFRAVPRDARHPVGVAALIGCRAAGEPGHDTRKDCKQDETHGSKFIAREVQEGQDPVAAREPARDHRRGLGVLPFSVYPRLSSK